MRFRAEDSFGPPGTFSAAWDMFVCHDWNEFSTCTPFYGRGGDRCQGCCNQFYHSEQTLTTKTYPLNVIAVAVEKPCSSSSFTWNIVSGSEFSALLEILPIWNLSRRMISKWEGYLKHYQTRHSERIQGCWIQRKGAQETMGARFITLETESHRMREVGLTEGN